MAGRLGVDRTRAAWWGFGVALTAAVLYVIQAFLGTFVFGVFIYYATRPVHVRLKRRIRPASLAAAVSIGVLALPVLALLVYTVAIGLQEFNRFSERYDVGNLESYFAPYIDASTVPGRPEEIIGGAGVDLAAIGGMVESAGSYLGVIGTGLLHLFVMIAIAFYLLRDDHRLSRWVRRRFSDDRGVLETYLDAVDESYHQVFFGNILNAVLTGTIGALVYNALDLAAPAGLGIPYPTLLGLLAGAASLVPIVGMKLVYLPATAYLAGIAVLDGDPGLLWVPAVFAGVSFVIVDTIPDLVLRPYVSGRSLHVGMVMIAYVLGPLLFGWYGIFLGPMVLVLIVHFVRVVLPELVGGEPIRPAGVDPSYLE
ncbi:MAG: AI-2E family transporter [Halobacteriales archaeon]